LSCKHPVEKVKQPAGAQGLNLWAVETPVMHTRRAITGSDATGLVFDRDGNPIS